jgi:hypothetical protein
MKRGCVRHRLYQAVLLLAVLCLPFVRAAAQGGARAFSIFLDCTDSSCGPNFYRTELDFVDHVRERTAADVHVLVADENTGGGGRRYTLAFYGQREFEGLSDTLVVTTPQGATEDERRRTLVRAIRLGLTRYLARTPEGSRVVVSLDAPTASAARADTTSDPWNAWVFRVGANMNGNSEQQYESANINGNVRAGRVTEKWKTNLRVDEYYSESKFMVNGERITTVRRDFGGSALQVRSLGEHLSLGARAGASSSTYLNQKLAANAAGAIEYDLYPYRESTRRQLVTQYSIGARHYVYNDTTIYFRIRESRPYESLSISFEEKQTWGSVYAGANGYHFLDDLSKSRLNISMSTDVRIVRGLTLSAAMNYSVIHDQLYLAKGKLSKDEVLLQQSQLQTGYRANYRLALNYTFGSVLNNVVNPRLTGNSDS